jgi:hypothetical protein
MPKLVAEGVANSFDESTTKTNGLKNEKRSAMTSDFWAMPSRFVDKWLKYWLRLLAFRVAKHPYLFALLPFAVSIIFVAGIPLLTTETEYHKLWYPTNTKQVMGVVLYWNVCSNKICAIFAAILFFLLLITSNF